mgnify:CR=1 FL=1|jgi:DNA-directed RNA polymerase specialized sigma24 family protein
MKEARRPDILSDEEYIRGLRAGDEGVTHRFFYSLLEPTITNIRHGLMGGAVDYDELVNELFLYLSDRDWRRLDSFSGRDGCSLRTWMVTLSWRYFLWRRENLLGAVTSDLDGLEAAHASLPSASDDIRMDVAMTLARMPNQRYAEVIRILLLEGFSPEDAASRLGVSVSNLYNLKHRAVLQFVKKYCEDR